MSLAHRVIAPLAAGVWRVEDAAGRNVVVKHQLFGRLTRGRAYDLLEVEREVLSILRAAGCPVPACLGVDPDAQCTRLCIPLLLFRIQLVAVQQRYKVLPTLPLQIYYRSR